MSRRSLLDPIKSLLRSPSGKKFRCDWCGETFPDHAQLSNHIVGSEQATSSNGQICTPAYRCDWCNSQFYSIFGLSEHIRGTTRSTSALGNECVLDSLDPSSKSQQFENEYENVKVASEVLEDEKTTPDSSDANQSQVDNEAAHVLEVIGEEAEDAELKSLGRPRETLSKPFMDETYDNLGPYPQHNSDERPELFFHPGMSHRPLPPPPISVPRGVSPTGSYEYWKSVISNRAQSIFDSNTALNLNASNSIKSTYNGPARLDTNGSTRTFVTARTSSVASYRTAPSFSRRGVPDSVTQPFLIRTSAVMDPHGIIDLPSLPGHAELSHHDQARTVDELIKQIITKSPTGQRLDPIEKNALDSIVSQRKDRLIENRNFSLASIAHEIEQMVNEIFELFVVPTDDLKAPLKFREFRGVVTRYVLDFVVLICDLAFLKDNLESYFREISSGPLFKRPIEVFSSQWLEYLKSRGLLLDSLHELDWSGRGQHVEYDPDEEKDIPLLAERVLGHSATAIVESVKCRRIRLARKKIRCTKRLSKERVIVEVEHLHRLQHAHILRFVGTYTFKKDLAILLYPATPWNLDEFMDELLDTNSLVNMDVLQTGKWRKRTGAQGLRTAFGCLGNALAFIHRSNVKHMDIKPKNLLVRARGEGTYRIYVADFGISRRYTSAIDAETDSPTSFTRTYAPPEVVRQDTRGLKVDIFSLGCVFLEMLATLVSSPGRNERQKLSDIRASGPEGSSFHANLDAVQAWYHELFQNPKEDDDFLPADLLDIAPKMLRRDPVQRPSADEVSQKLASLCCISCDSGPEPFEAAEDEF